MDTAILRAICLECLEAMPDGSYDQEEFDYHWESLEAKQLLGKAVSFGSPAVGEPERGIFSQDMDPVLEAIVIGVVSNLVYDLIKSGRRQLPLALPPLEEVLRKLGKVGAAARKTIAKAYECARAPIERHLKKLWGNQPPPGD